MAVGRGRQAVQPPVSILPPRVPAPRMGGLKLGYNPCMQGGWPCWRVPVTVLVRTSGLGDPSCSHSFCQGIAYQNELLG